MKSRLFAAGCGVLTLLGLTACGGSDGTGATTPTTTVKLAQTSYVTAAPVMTSTTAGATPPGAVGTVAGEQIYKVVTGDYMLGIAKKHCIDLATLVAYNAWPEGDQHRLFPGDDIKIPAGACAPGSQTEVTTAPDATTVEQTTTTFDPSVGGTYTVVAGDFLNGIATKNGTTVDAIVAANGWANGADHVIIPGQQIKLPAKTG